MTAPTGATSRDRPTRGTFTMTCRSHAPGRSTIIQSQARTWSTSPPRKSRRHIPATAPGAPSAQVTSTGRPASSRRRSSSATPPMRRSGSTTNWDTLTPRIAVPLKVRRRAWAPMKPIIVPSSSATRVGRGSGAQGSSTSIASINATGREKAAICACASLLTVGRSSRASGLIVAAISHGRYSESGFPAAAGLERDAGGPRVRFNEFDARRALEACSEFTASAVRRLRRRGAVVAVSGGVDSGVVAGICVARSGPSTCSASDSPSATSAAPRPTSAPELAEALGARTVEEPITAALEGLGCYRRRDEAIRSVFPDYEPSWRHKLVRSAPTGGLDRLLPRRRAPGRRPRSAGGMPPEAYRDLIAATNMKQRVRKLFEYTWADRLGYAVDRHAEPARVRPGVLRQGRRRAGRRQADRPPLQEPGLRARPRARPARGDRRARHRRRRPSACPQTQEEFYFGHPYERMDLLLWGHDRGHRADRACQLGGSARRRWRPPTGRSSAVASRPSTSTPPLVLMRPGD